MPEACPATCAPLCVATHGAKLVPSAPYEPPHQAPLGAAWPKAIAGMTSATAANATTPVHLISHSPSVGDSLQSTPLRRTAPSPRAIGILRADPESATRVPGPAPRGERHSGADLGGGTGARARPRGPPLPENATDRCRSDRKLTSRKHCEHAAPCTTLAFVVRNWIDRNLLALAREMRLSYLPPLMVYVAAGVAGLITASLVIMIGLLAAPASMGAWWSVEAWFVAGALLSPIGYVVQDVVADAMTVEAVPRFDGDGRPIGLAERKSMKTTVQTLGRVAIIGGTVLVALANVYLLRGAAEMAEAEKTLAYLRVYELALIIPVVSVLGVVLGMALAWRDARRLRAKGFARAELSRMLNPHGERPPVNWWILGGGLAFAVISLGVGVGQLPGAEEIVFSLSMAIVLFLIWRLTGELEPDARHVLVGTAIVVFVFRALPGPGAGSTWWMIDRLGFDQQFLAELSVIG